MSETSYLRRNWKIILNVATIVALIVLVVAIRGQFKVTFENLFRVHIWALLLIPVMQALNYDAQARLYRDLFAIVGSRVTYKELYRVALEVNYVNTVFHSAGASGILYMGTRLKDDGITGPQASAVQLFKLVLYFLSFEGLIVLGVFALAVQGHMNSVILLLAGSLATAVVMLTGAVGFIVSSKKRIKGFFVYMTKWINRVIRVVRPKRQGAVSIDGIQRVFEDLHENYVVISRDWQQLKRPMIWAMLASFWEIMTIYVVYIAFGAWVNIGAVILAYAVANFAGLLSVLPGGVGMYEGLMTLTLSATGVPSRLSLPVTIMYRILATTVQLVPGAFLYHKRLGRKEPSKSDAGAT